MIPWNNQNCKAKDGQATKYAAITEIAITNVDLHSV
jgi:hypothetical protein